MEIICNQKKAINKNNIIKTESEQFDKFFYSGHPTFLIPEFSEYPEDIWLSFMSYLEKVNNKTIYDQDGGEITYHKIIDDTGLTVCTYEAYGISFSEDEDLVDYKLEITGYVISRDKMCADFYATKIKL